MMFSLTKKIDPPIEMCYSGVVRKTERIICRKLTSVIIFLRKRKIRISLSVFVSDVSM